MWCVRSTLLVFVLLGLLLVSVRLQAETDENLPSLSELYQQALRVMGLHSPDAEHWRSRARWKAILPQLRVGFQRDLKDQFRFTNQDNVSISGGEVTVGPDEQDLLRDFDAGTRFQATAVWYLDELVFNRDAILVSQERRRLQEERFVLLKELSNRYYSRLEAIKKLHSHALSASERLKLERHVEQVSAELDVLTDGYFSRAIP